MRPKPVEIFSHRFELRHDRRPPDSPRLLIDGRAPAETRCGTSGASASAPAGRTRRCVPTGRRTSARRSTRWGAVRPLPRRLPRRHVRVPRQPTAAASAAHAAAPSRSTRSPTSTRCSTPSCDTGARPFVELGFMPRELATQTETLFWWKAHCSPPKDMARWVELVTATVRALDRAVRPRRGAPVAVRGVERAEPGPALLDRDPDRSTSSCTRRRRGRSRPSTPSSRSADRPPASSSPTTATRGRPRTARPRSPRRRRPTSTRSTGAGVDRGVHRLVRAAASVPVDFLSTHLYPTDYAFGADGAGASPSPHADATHDDLASLRTIIAEQPLPRRRGAHHRVVDARRRAATAMHDTVFAADLHHAGLPASARRSPTPSRTGPSPTSSRRAAPASARSTAASAWSTSRASTSRRSTPSRC